MITFLKSTVLPLLLLAATAGAQTAPTQSQNAPIQPPPVPPDILDRLAAMPPTEKLTLYIRFARDLSPAAAKHVKDADDAKKAKPQWQPLRVAGHKILYNAYEATMAEPPKK